MKLYNKAAIELVQEISALETRHKNNLQEGTYLRLHESYAALNLLEARKTAQQLLRRNQKMFECREKP